MVKGHNIRMVTKSLFVVLGCHSLLYPTATAFEEVQWPEYLTTLAKYSNIAVRAGTNVEFGLLSH